MTTKPNSDWQIMSIVANTIRARRNCGQSSAQPTVGRTWKAYLIVFALIIPGCADVRPVAKAVQCKNNFGKLYEALVTYTTEHRDVPRDMDGRASLEPLLLGIDPITAKCPAAKDEKNASYVFNPALTVGDLRPESKTIVACDQLPHHIGMVTGNPVTVVLIGNGKTVNMDLPIKEQEEWRRLFLAGDERAGSISLKEGLKEGTEYWHVDDILWYVGPEKGYVPNLTVDAKTEPSRIAW